MCGRSHVALPVAILVVLAAAISHASAADFLWLLPTAGNWSDPACWSPAGVPGSSPDDTATINAAGPEGGITPLCETGYMVNLDVDRTLGGFTLNSPDATLNACSHTFTVNGPANLLEGGLSWTASAWSGSGTLTNSAVAAFYGNDAINCPLIQNGTLVIRGEGTFPGNYPFADASLVVADGFTNSGIITLESYGNVRPTSSQLWINGSGRLVNAPTGVLNVNPGGDRTISAALTNDGTVNINASVELSGTNHTNNNAINIAAGASLSISASSTFNQNGGILRVDGTFSLAHGAFAFNGGTIQGFVTIGGGLAIAKGATGAASFLMNGVNSRLTGDVHVGQNITIRAAALAYQAKLTSSSGFTNAGTITVEGDHNMLIASGSGLVNASTGVLNLNSSSTSLSSIGAVVNNRGAIDVTNGAAFWYDVDNAGRIQLLSPGVIYMDEDFTQESTGQLSVTLGPANPAYSNHYLVVTGNATLDGTLKLDLADGFCPSPGDQFAVLTCGSRTAAFSDISNLTNVNGHAGLWLEPQYTPTGLTFLAKGLPGDANLDGKVAFADYLALEANFTKTGMGWADGDFDGNGKVSFADYLLLEQNFGQRIPEPATLALLAVNTLVMLPRRARRRTYRSALPSLRDAG